MTPKFPLVPLEIKTLFEKREDLDTIHKIVHERNGRYSFYLGIDADGLKINKRSREYMQVLFSYLVNTLLYFHLDSTSNILQQRTVWLLGGVLPTYV